MARDVSDSTPIESRDELVAWVASGEKPAMQWRLGTEHEKVPFYTADHAPVPYAGERGIGALLEGLRRETGWAPIHDGEALIGLADDAGGVDAIVDVLHLVERAVASLLGAVALAAEPDLVAAGPAHGALPTQRRASDDWTTTGVLR